MYAGTNTKLMSSTAAGGAAAATLGGTTVLIVLGLALVAVVLGAWLLMRGPRRHPSTTTSTSRG
ncbi:hypothetical protein [Mobilicoccus sp.]|uniref:hypothetical protein n=1 Tax=Mobilicoccus sp. TaxID=2034349 RepID=UPI002899AD6B|nr:hypothetical protein [Mobilicoccus sp.]